MDWLRAAHYFADVADEQNFSAVARLRHTSPSVITKHMDWLEDKLHTQLLKRSTRHVALTEAGQKFLHYVNELLENTQSITNELQNYQPELSGKLTVTTSKFLGETFFTDLFLQFHEQYPNIQLLFEATNRSVDMLNEDYDVAIRVSPVNDSRYCVKHLCEVPYGIYASPSYLKKQGDPKTPDELINHRCIGHFDAHKRNKWQLIPGKFFAINNVLSTNSFNLQLAAALNGLGIIIAPSYLMTDYVKQKKLIHILTAYPKNPLALSIVTRKNAQTARIKTFINFVHEHLPLHK